MDEWPGNIQWETKGQQTHQNKNCRHKWMIGLVICNGKQRVNKHIKTKTIAINE